MCFIEIPQWINYKYYLLCSLRLLPFCCAGKTPTSTINSFANANHSIGPQCQSQLLIWFYYSSFHVMSFLNPKTQRWTATTKTYDSVDTLTKGTCGCFLAVKCFWVSDFNMNVLKILQVDLGPPTSTKWNPTFGKRICKSKCNMNWTWIHVLHSEAVIFK